MSDAEEYVGCLQSSQARAYARKTYSHSETVHGKEVKYYHCYRLLKSPSGPFSENEEPNKTKIRQFGWFWRWVSGR